MCASSCMSASVSLHGHSAVQRAQVRDCRYVTQLLSAADGLPGAWPTHEQLQQQQQQQQQQQRPGAAPPPLPAAELAALLQQLDALGWQQVAHVSADLRSITLALHDAAQRRHTATLVLPPGFPAAAPEVAVSLPRAWRPRWLPGHSLAQLVAQLQQVLDSYQALWEQLEDLDAHTQLLDPQAALQQPYAHTSRCIALGHGCSMQLQLSPASPAAPPHVTFHGPSSRIAALQTRWYASAWQAWDAQLPVRRNVEAVLQLSLPAPKPGSRKGCAALAAAAAAAPEQQQQPPGSQHSGGGTLSDAAGDDSDGDDDEAGGCCICYALHLPDPARPSELGEAPSVACGGACCGRVFHAACLAEWLGALPSSRRVFDALFGACPYCRADISVSLSARPRG